MEGSNERSFIDFIAIDNRFKRDVLDAKVVRGIYNGSDHFAVLANVRMREEWEFRGKGKSEMRGKELTSERLYDIGCKQAHGRMAELLGE